MEISYASKAGFKIKTKGGVVMAAGDSVSVLHKGESGEGFVITQAGEYEIEGISVFGYQAEGASVFVIQIEDLRVLYSGKMNKSCFEKLAGELDNIDVVMIGTDTLSTKEAIEVVEKLEPYYVLPYGENAAKLIASYDHGSRAVKSLNLTKLSLNEDLTEVIVFE